MISAPEQAPAVLKVSPLGARCPHCRHAAVLMLGIITDGRPALAECGNCGRSWDSETLRRFAQAKKAS